MKFSTAIFKTFLLSLLVVAQVHFAYAQTASLLPNAVQQFFDNNGNPLTSGTVETFTPNTGTHKTTWQDSGQVTAWANPLTLNAAGRPPGDKGIFGNGSYRQLVKDSLGNIIWDQTTSSTGTASGSTSTATGDGDLVGTVKPWAGITAPSQYLFTYGQEVSRTTYSVLFTAMTSNQAVFCNSGSPVLSGLGDTTNFWVGMKVEVTCVPAGNSTVVSKTSSSITLAVNSNVTLNTTATFFPWGNGNGSTTFNLPDFRGLIPVGNNSMGGVASSNLTTTYFGSTDPNSIGALGGSQSHTMTVNELVSHSHPNSLNDPGHAHGQNASTLYNVSGTGQGGASGILANTSSLNTATNTTGITITNGSTGNTAPFSIVPPTRTVNYIIKVTPDANSATASGVTALGGMTGSITCGANITCTGNTISVPAFPSTVVTSINGNSGAIVGVDTNTLKSVVANYTIGASDNGYTIAATGGPFTITLPAVTGFATNATVNVCNGDPNDASHHAVRLSGFPSSVFKRLYMGTCVTVAIENGVWIAKNIPGRFHPAFTPTILIDNAGSDLNDGLVSNTTANSLLTVQACLDILKIEYDLSTNIQAICSPTGGQTFVGSFTIVGPLVGSGVFNITGNGGVAILQPTPTTGGYVLQLSDFAPYMISTNITFDCTGGTAGCMDISMHQQTGADLNAGTTLKGNATGHIGLACDSVCKVNVGANPLTVTGAFSSVVTLDQLSILNFNSGVSISSSANITGSLISLAHNSSAFFAGALTAGTGISISEIFTVRTNSTVCLNANFTTTGAFGAARQWSVLNNGIFGNASGVAVPGSTPGISTSTNYAAGILINNGLSSPQC